MKTTFDALAPRFDAFLIDQFGVLLDGSGTYPHAAATLEKLAGTGKAIVLLSNSGKRAAPNEARLSRLGFQRDSYKCVMSSGEVAHAEIASQIGGEITRNSKVWVHSRDDDRSSIEGLDLIEVDKAKDADLLIIAASRADEFDFEQYRNWLAPAANRNVPAFCTNPDIEMLTPFGKHFGAGAIAKLYEDIGGSVEWVGKPFPLVYKLAANALGQHDPTRVLCIGDSPVHDVKGGNNAGFATALVRTGLHADLTEDALMKHCQATAMPDYIIPSFNFSVP